MIVADERLNAVVVRGSRSDRATAAALLKILDTAEVPESLATNQPTLIPIKHARASQIEDVIQDTFRSQLSRTRSSGRLSPQVSVDDTSNALVVMAQEPLRTQITQLARTLDEAAADESAHSVKIIPLRKTNASRVQDALEAAMRRSTRSYRHRRPVM